jgi:hypothetical protein
MDIVGGLTVSNGPARKLVWDKNALMQSTLNETNAARPHAPPPRKPPLNIIPKPLRLSLRGLRIERVSLILGVGPD